MLKDNLLKVTIKMLYYCLLFSFSYFSYIACYQLGNLTKDMVNLWQPEVTDMLYS